MTTAPVLQTQCTELLRIQHPIVCGGMTATGSAELCAAVSNAGCLGMLTCLHCRTPERLHQEIRRAREMMDGNRPFGVNLTILGVKRGEPEYPHEFVDVIVRNHIEIVETCGGGVKLMRALHEELRRGGVRVIISKCVAVRHALTAQNVLGADMVSLMGADSGGLPGEDDTGLFVQAALAKRQLAIPFLLSGGVATGSQLVAALVLGAAGVQIGTRFNATHECNMLPESFKARMVAAGPRDTIVIMKPFRASSRVMRNTDAEAVAKIEREKGAHVNFSDIGALVKFERLREGLEQGNPDLGVWNCGQSTYLIDDVPTCADLVARLVHEVRCALHTVHEAAPRLSLHSSL